MAQYSCPEQLYSTAVFYHGQHGYARTGDGERTASDGSWTLKIAPLKSSHPSAGSLSLRAIFQISHFWTFDNPVIDVHTCMYVKAVGKKGACVAKISSRTFCAAVHKDHLSSHLAKTRSPNAARSPLISLLCPRAAGGRIVIPSVPQLKVFDTSDSPCWQSAAVTSSSSCRNLFAVR